MPRPQRSKTQDSVNPGVSRCSALTTSGRRCNRAAVPGLTVCKSHGGGTAASVRAGKRASVGQQAHQLWGISSDASSISVREQLEQLARNKIADITAIRIEVGSNPDEYYGLLVDSKEVESVGAGQFPGTNSKTTRKAGVHPLVGELHKAETELLAILKLLKEVSGDSEEVDLRRVRMQTAREAARLMKAFPGISVDEVALEVNKRAS